MMKKNPHYRPSAAQLLHEQAFLQIMKEYMKKKKIDALDLREITPKQLAIHKKAHRKAAKSGLPPLNSSPNRNDKKVSNSRVSEKLQRTEVSEDNQRKVQRRSSKSRVKTTTYLASSKEKIPKESTSKTPTNQSYKAKKEIRQDEQGRGSFDREGQNQYQKYDSKAQGTEEDTYIDRITQPDLSEGEYISLLCQAKLQILQERYSPNMSKIFEQTVQFEPQ